ncbi:MAG: PQQ-like beta-propeller repeat protein, partial [Phaeodactylibacter sp.]|nr:PQQ-like beta-propeller repeat protein [Phaeodactylibacter sp.]
MKTSRILILTASLALAGCLNPLLAQQIYFSDNNGVLYYTNVDNNCEVVTVGELLYDTGFNLATIYATDLAFHPNGNLYVTNGISLYEVDPATGMCLLIGNHSVDFSVYINALVAGGDGTLYGAGGSLYTVDINTGLATSLGGLPIGSAGDLAFNNGQLYMAGALNQLVSININNPPSSTVIGTMTAGYEFFGIVTSASECTDAITYGTSDNSLYSLDVSNAATTFVCDLVSSIIYGAAMPTEFTAEDCDFVLDLDGDDSSGADGSDFLAEPACDGGPFFIADTDLFIDTEEQIDSMHIYLAGGNIDAPFEVLDISMPSSVLDVTGLGTTFITVYNPGLALIGDFETFLGQVLYENTAMPPTPGIRYVNVQYFANGDTSNTATAILEILNVQEPQVDLGADQTLCEGEVVNL